MTYRYEKTEPDHGLCMRDLSCQVQDREQELLGAVAGEHLDHADERVDRVLFVRCLKQIVLDGKEVMTVALGDIGFEEADVVVVRVDKRQIGLRGLQGVEHERHGSDAIFLEGEFHTDIIVESAKLHALGDEVDFAFTLFFFKNQFLFVVFEEQFLGFDIIHVIFLLVNHCNSIIITVSDIVKNCLC